MSSYFDDIEVQKRVGRQYRRKFVYRVHLILSVLAVLGVMFDRYERLMYAIQDWAFFFGELIIISLIFLLPVALHQLWLRYREQMEAAVDREMKTAYEYRKRKHENAAYLTDDGELWQEEAFQQEKRKRLME